LELLHAPAHPAKKKKKKEEGEKLAVPFDDGELRGSLPKDEKILGQDRPLEEGGKRGKTILANSQSREKGERESWVSILSTSPEGAKGGEGGKITARHRLGVRKEGKKKRGERQPISAPKVCLSA